MRVNFVVLKVSQNKIFRSLKLAAKSLCCMFVVALFVKTCAKQTKTVFFTFVFNGSDRISTVTICFHIGSIKPFWCVNVEKCVGAVKN